MVARKERLHAIKPLLKNKLKHTKAEPNEAIKPWMKPRENFDGRKLFSSVCWMRKYPNENQLNCMRDQDREQWNFIGEGSLNISQKL